MKLPPNVVPRPYTRLAFEGWFFACDHGKGDEYNDSVYKAYFIDEKNIGDVEVLTALAENVGLDGAAFRAALENGTYTEAEKAAIDYARNELQPKGVPTIYINGEKVAVSEYTKDEMIRILSEQVPADEVFGFSCSEDGCN
jgi:predicted DsbA family dithiol-disulfide isomerase